MYCPCWQLNKVCLDFCLGMLKTFSTANVRKPFLWPQTKKQIDHFTDTADILNSIVLNIYYGMPRGQISVYVPPENPIIVIWNNGIQNAAVLVKRYFQWLIRRKYWTIMIVLVELLCLDQSAGYFCAHLMYT